MRAEEAAAGPTIGWNTWEELILGAAVVRHGEHDWNVVASELRARTRYPILFTPEVCKAKYEDLQKRYSGSSVWFEELRKQCVAELKQELARSEASIGFLESKIKHLEAEKLNSNHPNQADYAWSQTESPLPTLNSDGTESSSKKISKDEHSAGSYTKDTRTSWSCEHHQEMEIVTKPGVSVSPEHDKELSIEKLAKAGQGRGAITRKRRGERKRKDHNEAVKDRTAGDSDNLRSYSVVSTSQKEASTPDYDQTGDSGMKNHNGNSYTVKRNDLLEIFESIAQSEPAIVFRHRMDSQKRARYREIIRQHVDIDMIRSRIIRQSITSVKELFRDLLLLASNALVFYSRRTREYKSSLTLRHLVMKEYKQHCRGFCHEATDAFLTFSPPVKPRSARPRHQHRPPPCKDKVLDKLSNVENIVPPNNPKALEKPCDSDYDVSLHSLLKGKKGLKRPGKVKPESIHTQSKTSL